MQMTIGQNPTLSKSSIMGSRSRNFFLPKFSTTSAILRKNGQILGNFTLLYFFNQKLHHSNCYHFGKYLMYTFKWKIMYRQEIFQALTSPLKLAFWALQYSYKNSWRHNILQICIFESYHPCWYKEKNIYIYKVRQISNVGHVIRNIPW